MTSEENNLSNPMKNESDDIKKKNKKNKSKAKKASNIFKLPKFGKD